MDWVKTIMITLCYSYILIGIEILPDEEYQMDWVFSKRLKSFPKNYFKSVGRIQHSYHHSFSDTLTH